MLVDSLVQTWIIRSLKLDIRMFLHSGASCGHVFKTDEGKHPALYQKHWQDQSTFCAAWLHDLFAKPQGIPQLLLVPCSSTRGWRKTRLRPAILSFGLQDLIWGLSCFRVCCLKVLALQRDLSMWKDMRERTRAKRRVCSVGWRSCNAYYPPTKS